MFWYAITDAEGRIMRTTGATSEADALVNAEGMASEAWTAREAPGPLTPAEHWWSGAEFSPRPTLAHHALPATVATGALLTVEELPNGASVRVEDSDGVTVGAGVIADHALPMQFDYPGAFTIHIGEGDTAFPYRPRSYSLTVVDP